MQTADQHEARAQQIADSLRTHLVAFNTGGIAVALATAAALIDECVKPNWVVPATYFFATGLALVLVSLFLQKHKALKRRDAARDGKEEPNFKAWRWRNFTWDLFSFVAFCSGVAIALSALASLSPGCP